MNEICTNGHETPKWASKYDIPDAAAYWLDQFAHRGRPDIAIPCPADLGRLREFRKAMIEAGRPIVAATIKSILLNEYSFHDEYAQYYSIETLKGANFKELEEGHEHN